jgi:hypothetical protein
MNWLDWLQDRVNELLSALERIAAALELLAELAGERRWGA